MAMAASKGLEFLTFCIDIGIEYMA